jgi:hypothetical protein
MDRALVVLTLAMLVGCDIAGSGAATAAADPSPAEQAATAAAAQERVRQQIDAANQEAVAQRQRAETDNQ